MSKQLPRQQHFWRLALLNILSNLMVPLASLVDTAFLGHLTEISHLAGVAIATVLFNYIYWTFGFLRMGTTGLTAQARGRGESEQVMLILLRNSAIALGMGIIILLCQQPLRDLGFALLKAEPEVLDAGRDYYNALIFGAPATLMNFVLLGWFLGQENGGKVLLLSTLSNGANIVLDYLLIVRWGQGSMGAGAATALSQYLTLFLGLALVFRQLAFGNLRFHWGRLVNFSALKAILVLNRDILIRTLALVSTFAVFTNLSALMGTKILASNTLLLQVVTLAAYFIDGIAFATESIAGNLQGQGKENQLIPLLKLAGSASLIAGLGFATVFCLSPERLFGLLTNHNEVIAGVRTDVWWLFPILGFGSIAYMLDGYFIGLTAGKVLRQSTLVAALLGFAPSAIAAWYWQTNYLLWLALTLFMATRSVTLLLKLKTSRNIAEKI
ncbi:MAG: guanitoxin biosynthesis MATE family efflux transporter GntT [Pleurocapsa sp.]